MREITVRIALGLEYLGSQYHGWQKQAGLPTIQESLELALSQIANHPVEVYAAGRTDAGVHASNQVVHFDTESRRNPLAWTFGVNTFLPQDIRVNWAKVVSEDFHARFSAVSRSYRYIIHNSRTRSAILAQQLTWHPIPLEHGVMHEAAQHLIGEHDFSSFRGADCQAHSPVKTVIFCKVSRHQDFIVLEIKAGGFLHHMVRNIVGVLIEIAEGKKPVEWASEVLAARDRRAAAKMAGAQGLYLSQIEYPKVFDLPVTLPGPLFLHIV